MPIDLKTARKTASLPTRTVMVCLDGTLTSELREAESALLSLPVDPPRTSVTERPPSVVAQERVDRAREAAQAKALPFVLQALPDHEWTSLVARPDNAPRPGEKRDERLGYNEAALRLSLVRECLVDPKPDDNDWAWLSTQGLTFGQMDDLVAAAMLLCRRSDDLLVPTSPAVSATTEG